MELEILKHFCNKDVEILVGGVWIEGHMTPIVKGQITLLPFGEAAEFYGPAALKAESVQCIRQVKKDGAKANAQAAVAAQTPEPIKSGFESSHPGNRYVIVGKQKP
jgi:hypothetical protein